MYISDPDTYEIYYANDGVQKLIGGSYEGRKCYEAIIGNNVPCDFCTNHLLRHDAYYAWTRYNEKLGSYYALKDKLVDWHGRPARLEIAFDMSEHHRQLLGLETELNLERLLVRCVKEMRNIDGFSGDMSSVLRMIGEAMDADRAYIFQVAKTPDGREAFSTMHEWCAPGVQSQIDALQDVNVEMVPSWTPVLLRREAVVVEDVDNLKDTAPSEYDLLKPQGIDSVINAPLLVESELVGTIGIDNPKAVELERTREFFDNLSYFLSAELDAYRAKGLLESMACTDALTGLSNRNRYTTDIEALDAQGPRRGFGVAYFDLNGLKEINDSEGHARGDRTLSTVARAIGSAFGKARTYRLGGDEFLALALNAGEEEFRSQAELARSLLQDNACSTAMGLFYANEPCLVERAVSLADSEMYNSKRDYYMENPAADRRGAAR